MNFKNIIPFLCIPMIFGCATVRLEEPDAYLRRHKMDNFTRTNFQICYSHGCRTKADAHFTVQDWISIQNIFKPAPKDALSERALIAIAIQTMENLSGEKTKINKDIGGTFPGVFKPDQMDCEDEAINTNIFLILLQQDNLIEFHSFYGMAKRGLFINGWPHVACAIIETSTKKLFVVDSWFLDHGMPIHVLPEAEWKSGWRPDNQ